MSSLDLVFNSDEGGTAFLSNCSVIDKIAGQTEPLHLKRKESAEMRLLKDVLGWTAPKEVGKFYDHIGSYTCPTSLHS